MELTENELQPAESLRLITDVIGKTKENIKDHGGLFLLWGWLIAIASILFFVLHTYTSFKLYFLPFPVLSLAGIIVTLSAYSKQSASAETYIGYYLKMLWLALGISFIIVVVINVAKGDTPFTYTLLLGGIGTLVSGLVLRFRPLVVGGCCFLVACVISVFITHTYAPLVQAVAVIAGYLIPGYLLKNSKA
jgi:uncharacterized membrane protein HdeD (DUF308 family)